MKFRNQNKMNLKMNRKKIIKNNLIKQKLKKLKKMMNGARGGDTKYTKHFNVKYNLKLPHQM